MFSPGLLGSTPQSPKAAAAGSSSHQPAAGSKASANNANPSGGGSAGGSTPGNTALQMQLAAYAAMMGLPSMPLSQDTSKMSPEELTMLKMYEQMAAALTGKRVS